MTIKALCITEDPDRPTIATFVGLHRAGVQITVACPPAPGARETLRDAGVPLLDIDVGRHARLADIRRLREELERGGYRILHVFGNRPLQNGLLAARGLPVRIVAYRGIVGNVSFLDPFSWMRWLNPRIDRIICVCHAVRDHFLSMRPKFLRMPAERPVTIHKGHDLDWYRAEPADLTALGVPAGAFAVGCVANYRKRKGIEVLVEAIGALPSEWNVHLLLIGHMDSQTLTRAIEASPVRDRIHRTGYRADAPSLSAALDVFVLPSTSGEGLARSLIEAMAYGVAPVVTSVGGSPEAVVDGECGIVVPPHSAEAIAAALKRLYRDPALRRRFGAAARERIRKDFSIDDTIRKTLAVYRELVPKG